MTVVDVHTHLYREPDLVVEESLSTRPVDAIVDDYVQRIESGPADHALAIVMDDDFLGEEDALMMLLEGRDDHGIFSTAFLVDPLREDAADFIDKAAGLGAVGIKFHPYMHNLGPDTYSRVQEVGARIDEQDLLTIVDCSYGSEKLYEANGVELGHELARSVGSPVLLAHGGGPRVLDAFSAAEAMANVYIDTSFSLDYWEGSTVIRDFGFAATELDPDRLIWGSDDPYVDQRISFDRARRFAETHVQDPEAYFGNNAAELLEV